MRNIQVRFLATSVLCPVERLVNLYGLPSESASYIFNKLKLSGICSFNKLNPDRLKLQKCDSVFVVLKSYGFSGAQIAQLIQKRPSLLGTKPDNLKHMLQLLSEGGRSEGKNLSHLIVSDPSMLSFVKLPAPLSSSSIQHLVDSYALPIETATFVLHKLSAHGEKLKNFYSILELLKGYGFSDTQIATLIQKRPSMIGIKVDTLVPKLSFLSQKGLTGKKLIDLIVSHPAILNRGLESHLEPAWDILKKCFGTDDKVMAILMRSARFLTANLKKTAQPNIVMLLGEGVPQAAILKLITMQPWVILEKPEKMAYAIRVVKEFGRQPSSLMFIHAIRAVISVTEETWIQKIELFKNLGWTDEDIKRMFLHYPLCFATSNEKIKASCDFFLNEVKYDRSIIVAYPKYLMYGLEKRVRPRFNVLKVLKSMGLINGEVKFSAVVNRTEKDFVLKYILPYEVNIPHLMDIYRGNILTDKE
uniref:Uncharacterized protein n=1 Tax=Kalanchoe fedtschenkoi TaxID=63787 RepID=A0A7N0ZVS0_KALFE